jgi:hypothetical protein
MREDRLFILGILRSLGSDSMLHFRTIVSNQVSHRGRLRKLSTRLEDMFGTHFGPLFAGRQNDRAAILMYKGVTPILMWIGRHGCPFLT